MRMHAWTTLLLTPLLAMSSVAQINVNATQLAENNPSANVGGGSVQNRAPGRAVRMALSAHQQRTALRVAAQRSGDTSLLAVDGGIGGVIGGGNGGLGGLGGLLGGLLGGGSLGGLDLSGLLGSLGGSGGTGGSNLPPEVLDLLRQFGFDPDEILGMLGTARLAQDQITPLTAQSTGTPTEQPKFLVRWGNEMLSSLFTGLTLAVATPQFRSFLQDLFTPLFTPPSDESDDGATSRALDAVQPATETEGEALDPNAASI